MLPTPDTSHVDTSRVYEPAEDSFLFLDILSSDAETRFLRSRFRDGASPLVVEVGTGSGVVLAFVVANATPILGRADVCALGIDVNEVACRAAATTVRRCAASSAGVDVVQGDLLAGIRPGAVDLLMFNPPYVPTPSVPDLQARADAFAEGSRLLELAYAGGDAGMAVTRRFLAQLPHSLSATGVVYLLLCAQNRPADVVREIEAVHGLHAQVVGRSGKTGGWEKLCILRITWPSLEQTATARSTEI